MPEQAVIAPPEKKETKGQKARRLVREMMERRRPGQNEEFYKILEVLYWDERLF